MFCTVFEVVGQGAHHLRLPFWDNAAVIIWSRHFGVVLCYQISGRELFRHILFLGRSSTGCKSSQRHLIIVFPAFYGVAKDLLVLIIVFRLSHLQGILAPPIYYEEKLAPWKK